MFAIIDSLLEIVSKGVRTERPKTYEIPITDNTVNAIDFRHISTLGLTASPLARYEGGMRVMDPGFRNTVVCESSITHIDGLKGVIQCRGYSLDELVENHDFEAVAFLLTWGHLPQSRTYSSASLKNTPYHLLVEAGLAAWAATDPSKIPIFAGQELYLGKMDVVDERLIATFAASVTITALIYCHQNNRPFTAPDPNASVVENILLMMGVVDATTARPPTKLVRILNKLWIIYADHEMTNSTAAAMHVGSSLADPIAVCMAATCAGSGPLHAGAIDLAYKMFSRVGSRENVPGGHRIYKAVDPRVKHLRAMLAELYVGQEMDGPLAVAMEFDRVASTDSYFTSRHLKVNADLYGCFVFSAMGFEPEIITALMMTARACGILAHWREMMGQPPNIWRPQQRYTGARS
ncbi:citrate synthase [Aspergillus aurantiobrunneus]